MFSGVSGLRVHQTKMDVIANNISNVNTVGFKSARVTFNEVFSQALSGASAPNPETNRGGINPMQVGLGASVAAIEKRMTNGAAQRTDNPLDLMIQGDGFFIVADGSGQYFTRDGSFTEDKDGTLSLNGRKLMGWDAVLNTQGTDYVIEKTVVKPIVIGGSKEYMPPTSTTQIDFSGNINPNTDPIINRIFSFFDTVGNKYAMELTLEYDLANSTDTESVWNIVFPAPAVMYPNGDRTNPIDAGALTDFTITFDQYGQIFDIDGTPVTPGDPLSYLLPFTIDPPNKLDPPALIGNGQATDNLFMNFLDINQFVNESSTVIAMNRDGNAPGRLTGVSVGGDGIMTGRYSNGLVRILAQVPVAEFKNPGGLLRNGNNLYTVSSNSGDFDGVGRIGEIQGGVLEMSNVDLSLEFTEMITTQRGFQANSRIITTSDEMLQELVNLKR
jgi:flagellar hook protein FlgE